MLYARALCACKWNLNLNETNKLKGSRLKYISENYSKATKLCRFKQLFCTFSKRDQKQGKIASITSIH